MKNIRAAILAVCLGTLGSVAALAQTENTAYGTGALVSNTTGSYNSALGDDALYFNTTGPDNTATGMVTLFSNTTGAANKAIGMGALRGSTTGDNNIGIGYSVGAETTTGNYNIEIGNFGTSTDSGVTRIGTSGQQTSFYAAGISGVTIGDGVEVFINSSGQLGTVNSSIRFKQDVHDMADASDRLFQLRPVTYRYKQVYADGSQPVKYGLIAEEVAKVYPDLVVKGADGQIQTVQYQKLTPLLLNEVQKQHRLLEEQQQTIAQQSEAIQELKQQQAETSRILEKRLAALEAAQTSGSPAVRLAANVLQGSGPTLR
jgi:hypothetical protein